MKVCSKGKQLNAELAKLDYSQYDFTVPILTILKFINNPPKSYKFVHLNLTKTACFQLICKILSPANDSNYKYL